MAEDKPGKAYAVVQLTVEIHMAAPWGDDCQVGQIKKQAHREALEAFARVLEKGTKQAGVHVNVSQQTVLKVVITDG